MENSISHGESIILSRIKLGWICVVNCWWNHIPRQGPCITHHTELHEATGRAHAWSINAWLGAFYRPAEEQDEEVTAVWVMVTMDQELALRGDHSVLLWWKPCHPRTPGC